MKKIRTIMLLMMIFGYLSYVYSADEHPQVLTLSFNTEIKDFPVKFDALIDKPFNADSICLDSVKVWIGQQLIPGADAKSVLSMGYSALMKESKVKYLESEEKNISVSGNNSKDMVANFSYSIEFRMQYNGSHILSYSSSATHIQGSQHAETTVTGATFSKDDGHIIRLKELFNAPDDNELQKTLTRYTNEYNCTVADIMSSTPWTESGNIIFTISAETKTTTVISIPANQLMPYLSKNAKEFLNK